MKKLLVFGVLLSITFTSFSQKRVSGYYRKNGTYVSSYTRGGSSSYSGGGYSSSTEKEETPKEQTIPSTLNVNDNGFEIYVSVLTYNNETIDVQQISQRYSFNKITEKNSSGVYTNWGDIQHSFDSNKISQEETLRLVSEYGWYLKDGKLSKTLSWVDRINNTEIKFPSFLTHSFQIVKLK